MGTLLTVVIPAWNAAAALPRTIGVLAGTPVIVADGGSTDSTAAVARNLGARLVVSPRGRGAQLAAGIAAAETPWLLLLHADTRPARDWPAAARAHIAGWPDHAGYFDFALDTNHRRARGLERAVAWRCRRLALPYGDQGLLISRSLLDAVGGIRPLRLMEDVDLARRLGRDRLRRLGCPALTSAARWERDGWWRRSARNLTCLALYRCGLPQAALVRLYG